MSLNPELQPSIQWKVLSHDDLKSGARSFDRGNTGADLKTDVWADLKTDVWNKGITSRFPCASTGNTTDKLKQVVLRVTTANAPVRGVKVPGGHFMFSVYDFMWNTGAYESKGLVNKIFLLMISSGYYKDEINRMCMYIKFPKGQGQRWTPCMNVLGLQRLLGLLDGRIGSEYRALAETVLTMVACGDTSVIGELHNTSLAEEPLHWLAKEAVAMKPPPIVSAPSPIVVKDEAANSVVVKREPTAAEPMLVESFDLAAVSVRNYVLERKQLMDVLQASNPLLQQDVQLSRERLQVEKDRLAVQKEKIEMDLQEETLQKIKHQDVTKSIQEFLALSFEQRKAMRPLLSSQLEHVMPNKRARSLYVGSLMCRDL